MEFPTGNRFYYFCNLYIDEQELHASLDRLDYISIFLKRVQKCCTAKNITVSSSPLSVSGSPSLNSKSPIPSMAQRFTMSLAISATRLPGTRSKSSSLVSIRFPSSKLYSYHKPGVFFSRDLRNLPCPPREERELPILITYEEYSMSLPYCSLHERLFLSSRNEWMDFSQKNINRIKNLSILPPSSDLAFSQLK